MTLTALLHPSEAVPMAPVTARAFRMGGAVGPNRAAFEFYPTPPEATRALLAVERFDGGVWEPACGQGHIAKELAQAGCEVVATDLVDYGYGQPRRDFLAEPRALAKHIVTNPPYGRGLGDAFCRHALRLTAETGGKVAMLLPVQSLCSPFRHDFFVRNPPATVYALDECGCWPNGDYHKATASLLRQRYCWVVWDPTKTSGSAFRWLSTRRC